MSVLQAAAARFTTSDAPNESKKSIEFNNLSLRKPSWARPRAAIEPPSDRQPTALEPPFRRP
jgi:hypothetical protein